MTPLAAALFGLSAFCWLAGLGAYMIHPWRYPFRWWVAGAVTGLAFVGLTY